MRCCCFNKGGVDQQNREILMGFQKNGKMEAEAIHNSSRILTTKRNTEMRHNWKMRLT